MLDRKRNTRDDSDWGLLQVLVSMIMQNSNKINFFFFFKVAQSNENHSEFRKTQNFWKGIVTRIYVQCNAVIKPSLNLMAAAARITVFTVW